MVEFLKTLAIACIPAIITGIVTYIVARKNAASQISIIKEQNKHDLEKLMEQHKVDIEHLKEAHRLDMEAKEQDHKNKLELQQKEFENSLLTRRRFPTPTISAMWSWKISTSPMCRCISCPTISSPCTPCI